ncbi:MAG: hypothetical protein JWQ14_1961, partial [Adhaeribacter sp.]|nr:hypothetical protein [Adhaeribacter sp.]
MKKLFLLLCGLLVAMPVFCQVHDTLAYQANRKLTWADFKGKPKLADRANGAQITV